LHNPPWEIIPYLLTSGRECRVFGLVDLSLGPIQHLSIDDPDYTASSSLPAVITSGQDNNIQDDIAVTRKQRTDFSVTVNGMCFFFDGNQDMQPLPGITVKIEFLDDNGNHTLYDRTDGNGNYSLLVQWTNSNPTNDPEGEDELSINITYLLRN